MWKEKRCFVSLGDQVTHSGKCPNTNPSGDSTFSMLRHVFHVTLYHDTETFHKDVWILWPKTQTHTSVLSPHFCTAVFWRGGNVALRTKQRMRFYKDYRINSEDNWMAVARNLCSYHSRDVKFVSQNEKSNTKFISYSVILIHVKHGYAKCPNEENKSIWG